MNIWSNETWYGANLFKEMTIFEKKCIFPIKIHKLFLKLDQFFFYNMDQFWSEIDQF